MKRHNDNPDGRQRRRGRNTVRLGPDRLPAISLDAPISDDADLRIIDVLPDTAEPRYILPADVWSRIARALRFSSVELRVFHAHYRRLIPRYELARYLGMTPRYIDSALDSISKSSNSPQIRSLFALEPLAQSRGLSYRQGNHGGLLRCRIRSPKS